MLNANRRKSTQLKLMTSACFHICHPYCRYGYAKVDYGISQRTKASKTRCYLQASDILSWGRLLTLPVSLWTSNFSFSLHPLRHRCCISTVAFQNFT